MSSVHSVHGSRIEQTHNVQQTGDVSPARGPSHGPHAPAVTAADQHHCLHRAQTHDEVNEAWAGVSASSHSASLNDLRNHGQEVSAAAHAGVQGQELASVAKGEQELTPELMEAIRASNAAFIAATRPNPLLQPEYETEYSRNKGPEPEPAEEEYYSQDTSDAWGS